MGTSLANRTSVNESQKDPRFYKVRKKTVWIIGGVIFAGILALTPIFVHLFGEMHAANVVLAAFGDALIAKDYERAYKMTTPEFHAAISEADFAKQQTTLCSSLGSLKAVTSGASETDGNASG